MIANYVFASESTVPKENSQSYIFNPAFCHTFELKSNECCGPGSERIRMFVKDPDPADKFRSGTGSERIPILISCSET